MLLFSKHGFFSAVLNNTNKNMFHVRARFKNDLERLCLDYGIRPAVTHTPLNYYPYRMDFGKFDWLEIVMKEAGSVDYDSFEKGTRDGTKRDKAYAEVLAVMKKYSD